MKHPRKRPAGTKIGKLLLFLLAVTLASLCLEYFFNFPVLYRAQKGVMDIPLDQVITEGFEHSEQGLLLKDEQGRITIPVNGAFVGKFVYRYQYEHLLNAKIYVNYYNPYGIADENQNMILEDHNPKLNQQSYLKIGKKVKEIVLVIDKTKLGEAGSRQEAAALPLRITGLQLANVPQMNWYRILFVWSALFLAGFLVLYRDYISKHVQAAFLTVGLVLGSLMILCMPANKTGFDEETHLYRVLGIASFPSGMNVNQTIFSFMQPHLDTWPENQPGSMEEQRFLREYVNEHGDYKTGNIHLDPEVPAGTIPAYLGQALLQKIGKGMNLPWGNLFILGRFGNLFVYLALVWLAIKMTPVGKVIMGIIALMPTSLFLACTYSYDPWVTGWIFLGCGLFLREVLSPEKPLSAKSAIALLAALFIGISAKAVYAPMMLLALLIPKEKFTDKKQKLAFWGAAIALLLVLLSSFVLPVLFAPKATGDLRGGATSEAGQMSYILGNFIGYLQILFANIFSALPKMVFGKEIFSVLGHLADSPVTWLSMGLLVYVVVTDLAADTGRYLKFTQKFWIFILLGAAVLLVWTSMYIAYTEPGKLVIAGVQGRYYLPVLYLFYLLFNSRAVVAPVKNMWYHTGVFSVSAVGLLAAIYHSLLISCCI